MFRIISLSVVLSLSAIAEPVTITGEAWERFVIDDTSQGADGVRPGDIDGDGLPDLTTPWEEGGAIRVYFNPGPEKAREKWPAVTVGRVPAPEDAVFADVNCDGVLDVVSCTEGESKTVFFHIAPEKKEELADGAAWRTVALPASKRDIRWMFCLPMQIDGKNGIDLVAGSKNGRAELGWFEAPADSDDPDAWQYHVLLRLSWVMTIDAMNMDGDGLPDIFYSDRMAPASRGCYWLKNPGSDFMKKQSWLKTCMGARQHEVMFMAVRKPERRDPDTAICATKDNGLVLMTRQGGKWEESTIPMPEKTGTGKGVAFADLDKDGRDEIVVTCEHSKNLHGVFYLKEEGKAYSAHAVGGITGTKFDLIQMMDLDGDGFEDILTCEEIENLGVIWYRNPGRKAAAADKADE